MNLHVYIIKRKEGTHERDTPTILRRLVKSSCKTILPFQYKDYSTIPMHYKQHNAVTCLNRKTTFLLFVHGPLSQTVLLFNTDSFCATKWLKTKDHISFHHAVLFLSLPVIPLCWNGGTGYNHQTSVQKSYTH